MLFVPLQVGAGARGVGTLGTHGVLQWVLAIEIADLWPQVFDASEVRTKLSQRWEMWWTRNVDEEVNAFFITTVVPKVKVPEDEAVSSGSGTMA